jgi:uncharacterized membrane protein
VTSKTSRIEAFSDGVFSIAATLLVLELKPPAAGVPFWSGLAAQWTGFASFLLSFLFIGIMWMNHHRFFSRLRRADDVLMLTNLLLLLGVVWIPYPTLLMAQAVTKGDLRDPAILYNGSYLVIAILFNMQLYAAIRRGVADPGLTGIRHIAQSYLVGPVMYAISFVLTWWSVPVSLALNAAMAFYFLLSPSLRVRRPATQPAGERS